jgi:hypothetical protein
MLVWNQGLVQHCIAIIRLMDWTCKMTCQMLMKRRWKLVIHLLALMLVLRWLPLAVNDLVRCSIPGHNISVLVVDARFSVIWSSVISVPIEVFSTWNLNSVIHVLIRFRMVSTLCRKLSEIVPKLILKSYRLGSLSVVENVIVIWTLVSLPCSSWMVRVCVTYRMSSWVSSLLNV